MGIRICPDCGGKVSTSRDLCIHCGYIFKNSKRCPDCDEYVDADLSECPICGYLFNVDNNEDNTGGFSEPNVERIPVEDTTPEETIDCNTVDSADGIANEDIEAIPFQEDAESVSFQDENENSNLNNAVICPYCSCEEHIPIGIDYYMCSQCKGKFLNLSGGTDFDAVNNIGGFDRSEPSAIVNESFKNDDYTNNVPPEPTRAIVRRERLEEEPPASRREFKNAKPKNRAKGFAIFGSLGLISVALITLLVLTVFIPMVKFSQADSLINQGKLDEALRIFEEHDYKMEKYGILGTFFDSTTKVAAIKTVKMLDSKIFTATLAEQRIKIMLNYGVPVKVIYELDGGYLSGKSNVSTQNGSLQYTYTAISEFDGLKVPARTDYDFTGWKGVECSYVVGGELTLKIKALWRNAVYNITYDLSGGYLSEENPTSYDITDNSFTLNSPERAGYKFIGWTGTGLTAPTMTVTIPKGSKGDRNYVAKWENESYTLTFDANGGSVTPQSMNVTYGSTFTLPTPITTQDCLKFDGWYVGTRKLESGIWNEAQDSIAIAKWVASHSGDDGYCTICGEEIPRYNRFGDYIYFGEYPQTIKADSVTVTSATDSRGYYLGSDGYYYAKVTASPYEYGSGYTFSTGTTVTSGTVYYFKVEPIRWRILSEDGESAFILCDSIIANKEYDSSSNNYKDSDIRAWLNDTFFKTAFTELQQQIILTTTVDNSVASTCYSVNPYACEDTEDKIFLLSYKEVTNSAYGFSSSSSTYDTARRMSTSDYSRATGVWMSIDSGYYGNGDWWLRSPSNYSIYARYVYSGGCVGDGGTVYSTIFGVVPALRIRL